MQSNLLLGLDLVNKYWKINYGVAWPRLMTSKKINISAAKDEFSKNRNNKGCRSFRAEIIQKVIIFNMCAEEMCFFFSLCYWSCKIKINYEVLQMVVIKKRKSHENRLGACKFRRTTSSHEAVVASGLDQVHCGLILLWSRGWMIANRYFDNYSEFGDD